MTSYPPGHEWFVTSPCGMVSVTSTDRKAVWHVWIYDYMIPEPFANEVKAVMHLQKLTRIAR